MTLIDSLAAERAREAYRRQALDQRLIRLGYQLQTRESCGHHEGCPVGLVPGADCRCSAIAASMRASRALLRR